MSNYLHHYTTVESLEKILKNRTIRFTSLSVADDLDETESADIANIGRFVFVNCWTAAEEKYAMWDSRYADHMKGVRISLPKFPFEKYQINELKMKNGKSVEGQNGSFETFIPSDPSNDNNFAISRFDESNFLTQIEYTDDSELLRPKILNIDEKKEHSEGKSTTTTNKTINIGLIGLYKSKVWEDQREFRYRFYVAPITFREMKLINNTNDVTNLFHRFMDQKIQLPFDHFDLSITTPMFAKMIITTGPKMDDSNRKRVLALVKDFNPAAEIRNSVIKIRA